MTVKLDETHFVRIAMFHFLVTVIAVQNFQNIV